MLKPLAKIKNIKSPIITISFVIVFLLICSVALGIVLYDHYSKPEQPVLADFEITSTSSSSFRIVNNGGDSINFDENMVLILESEGKAYELNSSVIKVLKSGEAYEVDLTQQPYAVKIDPGKKVTVKVVDSTKDSVILEEEVIVADGNNTSSDSSIYNKNNTTNNSVSTEGSSALSMIDSSINNSNISSYDLEYVSNISSTEDTQNSSGMIELFDPYLSNSTASDDNAQLDNIGINSDVPEESKEGTTVLFIDSLENPIAGGVVQYYKGGWKDFGITDSDGKITQVLDDGIYTFRLTYGNSSKNIRQDIRLDNKIEFQTVNTIVTLSNSNNIIIDTDAATVQYYAAGWKTLGTTSNGTVQKELLPANYTFRIIYSNVSKNMKQDIGIDNTVEFRTANAVVSLYNSHNNIIDIDAATVQYFAAGWKTLGITSNGTVQKELLPSNYTFRLTYSNVSKNMKQDIGIDNTVDFRTANAIVSLYDSHNNIIDTDAATVQYYAAGWKTLGTTSHGTAQKELLPSNYTFRLTYSNVSKNMKQDIGIDNTVDFRTANAIVSLYDSHNNIIDTDAATVQYFAAGWKTLGITSNGTVQKELLPANYTFRLTYSNVSKNMKQDIGIDNTVDFRTAKTIVSLYDSNNNVIDTDAATVQYYAAGWKTLGTTSHGTVQKELLPSNYTFRLTYSNVSKNMKQDIGIDNTVDFRTAKTIVSLYDSNNNVIDTDAATVQYYAAGWKTLGTTSHGTVSKELLPSNYTFRLTYSNVSKNMKQDIGIDNTVDFRTAKTIVSLYDSNNNIIDTDAATVQYYAAGWKTLGTTSHGTVQKELLPSNYTFRLTYSNVSKNMKQDIGIDNTVDFQTGKTVYLFDTCTYYYASGWKTFTNGMELMPGEYSFKYSDKASRKYTITAGKTTYIDRVLSI